MKKRQKKDLIDDFDYLSNAASTTDCTGLIPSLPQNEAELEAYNDIVQYMSPIAKNSNNSEITTLSKDKHPHSS